MVTSGSSKKPSHGDSKFFEVKSFAYRPRAATTADPGFSKAARIVHDTKQSLALARALDVEYGLTEKPEGIDALLRMREASHTTCRSISAYSVPAVHYHTGSLHDLRFYAIFQIRADPCCLFAGVIGCNATRLALSDHCCCCCWWCQVEEAIETSPLSTAKLDLVCAYLKRVHFFVYYRGHQCRDEGDMIASRSACRGVEAASKEDVAEVSQFVHASCDGAGTVIVHLAVT